MDAKDAFRESVTSDDAEPVPGIGVRLQSGL